MKSCIFCKIVKGQIPCYKIYEDQDYLAFLDIAPYSTANTLVIPKKHYRWVWDVEDIGEYFKVVKKIANHFQKKLNTSWITSLVWGMDVPHAHVHLIPDPKFGLDWTHGKLDREKAQQLVGKLKLDKD